jgi:hypothetical protein
MAMPLALELCHRRTGLTSAGRSQSVIQPLSVCLNTLGRESFVASLTLQGPFRERPQKALDGSIRKKRAPHDANHAARVSVRVRSEPSRNLPCGLRIRDTSS